MRRAGHWVVIALLFEMPLVALLFFTGCEVSGNYNDDNVKVQFGNTNRPVQVHMQ